MRADAQRKRRQLLDAARELIGEQGGDIPLNAVAQRARVGIATLYRHFPTRDDLVLAVLEDVRSDIFALIDQALTDWGADPLAAWRSYVHALARLRLGTIAANLGPVIEGLPIEARTLRDEGLAKAGEVIDLARQTGLVDDEVTAERFQLGMATLSRALPHTSIVLALDEYEWLVETYLRGLEPRPA